MPGLKRQRSLSSDGYTTQGDSQYTTSGKRMGGKMSVRGKRASKQLMNRAAVKKLITNMAEKKNAMYSNVYEVLSYNAQEWLENSMLPLTPYGLHMQVDQGVSQDQRIGNKIRPQKTTIEMVMTPYQQDAATNLNPTPVMIRLLVFSRKDNNDIPANLNDLFQFGSSAIAPTSNGFDVIRPINKDEYTCYYDTVVKLGTSAWDTVGITAPQGNYNNNDYTMNPRVSIDVSKYIPSIVTYNDGDGQPSSKGVFVTWFAVRSDGKSAIPDQRYGTVFVQTKMTYTDE